MSGIFGGLFGPLHGIVTRPEDMRALTRQELAAWEQRQWAEEMRARRDPSLQAYIALNAWSFREPKREPGIYWTRTSGNTHRVEIVRD